MRPTAKLTGIVFLLAMLSSPVITGQTIQAWSATDPFPTQSVYYPGTEKLQNDEMRVVACGTGMPQPRLKQAGSCFLVELGNGDKFNEKHGTQIEPMLSKIPFRE